MKSTAIIGAGASGCFTSILLHRRHPDWKITVFEAAKRPMAKLAVTGGGRCNITNSFEHVRSLKDVYPRGTNLMKRLLKSFSANDLLAWFENEGIRFTTQEDGCVFPCSQDAMQIVRCLERLMSESGVQLRCETRVLKITDLGDHRYRLTFADGREEDFDNVILSSGGTSADFLRSMLPQDIGITPTVPSLFTFRTGDDALKSLMGTVVEHTRLSIPGSGISSEGILLVTDWGLSGPAALKLSSYAARFLNEKQYRAPLCINWAGCTENEVHEEIALLSEANSKKLVVNAGLSRLSTRLWKHLCQKSGISGDARWADIGKKATNKLCSTLCADNEEIIGRVNFKDEFVTCGGVALSEINSADMECKKHNGLYFTGEVLDIDAVTGGFNLQTAWSTAFAVAAGL